MSRRQRGYRTRDYYTITELTREFDISTRTIRFYEEQGLLAPERVGSQRIYSARDRARLILILRGKKLGFSLRDILAGGETVSGDAQVQPVLMGLQLALTELWRSYGVHPDAVIGHSMGGFLTLRALVERRIAPDAAVLVAARKAQIDA